jgi:protease-4
MQENDLSSELVNDILKEKRRDRRWKNIRFIAWFGLIIYAFCAIGSLFNESPLPGASTKHNQVALIRLDGMIAPGRAFSGEELIPLLKEAFSDKEMTGIILDINSGGGTPVQSAIIHDAIKQFKKKYNKKIIVVGEDLLTSGAYYVAIAADKIYVNPNTITGSIGVVMKGFGFVDLMKKIGVERRVYIAGTDKDRLDPFLPQNPDDIKKIREVINEVHQNFVRAVLEDRKGKLRADPSLLFTGDFWSGETALKLGLVDGLGNLMDVLDKEFHTSHYKEYGNTPNIFKVLGSEVSSAFDKMVYF